VAGSILQKDFQKQSKNSIDVTVFLILSYHTIIKSKNLKWSLLFKYISNVHICIFFCGRNIKGQSLIFLLLFNVCNPFMNFSLKYFNSVFDRQTEESEHSLTTNN